MNFAKILAELMSEMPSIEGLGESLTTEFNNIFHGEGGAQKVQKVLSTAATIAGQAAAVAVGLGIDPVPHQAAAASEAKASVADVHGDEVAAVAVPDSPHSGPLADVAAEQPEPETEG